MPSDNVQASQWPPELDAMAAAPGYHTVLLENDRVRVLETRIPPGHRTPVHTHCWPGVLYILSWSHFIRRDDDENILVESAKVEALQNPPSVSWSPVLPPHTFENVGNVDFHAINVELKEMAT